MTYTIKNEFLSAKISGLGAELISVVAEDGYEYIWSGKEWAGHAPLLFPVCGRLKDKKYTYRGKEYPMGSHGFAKISEFELLDCAEDEITLVLKANGETKKIYPFDFKLTARYSLEGKALRAAFTVENKDTDVLPYMFGWHPGFNLEGEAPLSDFYLDFGKKECLGLHPLQNGPFVNPNRESFPLSGGKYFVNNGEIAKIDTYILVDTDNHATLGSDSAKHSVSISWSENIPYFCVWKAPEEEARFLCLEPWSNVPADGVTPECFDTRVMSRLNPNGTAEYLYCVEFN